MKKIIRTYNPKSHKTKKEFILGAIIGSAVWSLVEELGGIFRVEFDKKTKELVDIWESIDNKTRRKKLFELFGFVISSTISESIDAQMENVLSGHKEGLKNIKNQIQNPSNETETDIIYSLTTKSVEHEEDYTINFTGDIVDNKITIFADGNEELNGKIQNIIGGLPDAKMVFTFTMGVPYKWSYLSIKSKNENLSFNQYINKIEELIIEQKNKIIKKFEEASEENKSIEPKISKKQTDIMVAKILQIQEELKENPKKYKNNKNINDYILKKTDILKNLLNAFENNNIEKVNELYPKIKDITFLYEEGLDTESNIERIQKNLKQKGVSADMDVQSKNKHVKTAGKRIKDESIIDDYKDALVKIIYSVILPYIFAGKIKVVKQFTPDDSFAEGSLKGYKLNEDNGLNIFIQELQPGQSGQGIIPLKDIKNNEQYYVFSNSVERKNDGKVNFKITDDAQLYMGSADKALNNTGTEAGIGFVFELGGKEYITTSDGIEKYK